MHMNIDKLDLFENTSELSGIPLYIGEWNNVKRVQTYENGKSVWIIDETLVYSKRIITEQEHLWCGNGNDIYFPFFSLDLYQKVLTHIANNSYFT